MNGGYATSCINTSILKWQMPGQALGTENLLNDEFMAVFSHELRNSLGAIRNAAVVLRMETSAGPAAVRARAVIERQVGQMTRLVEDLLDTSRIQQGKLRLQLERVDLCAVVSQCLQTVELAMQERNHRVSTSFPDRPLWVDADSSRLEQVFVNLLLNAAKYTDAGGEVALSVRRQADDAIVRICDTGIGIAPEILPNVFELFVQADAAQRSTDAGLGIGLALVRGLVESHGGCVTVASAGLRQGSEFTVRLPLPAES
jgi:signal transduction histidine kinase